ncbi:MAG TPA: DHH family phosphoesterase [Candidatus Saccharimonas sp.]|nr:DHH family phosphoesterase [Candidatus Saccharimonas sp.]
MELTPKQQTSEAIRQAETILITSAQHPTVDQTAAVLAMAAILRKFGKKVSAIISDPLPQGAQFLDASVLDKGLSGMRDFVLKVNVTKAEVDKLRYEVEDGKLNIYITPARGGFAPSDVTFDYGNFQYDLAIVLGVPNRGRIDRVYTDNSRLFETIPLVNVDFHRTNENYGAINLIEPTASSLCEILIALSESLQTGMIDAEIATVMLAGLMASTDRFTASHTTSKSLTVAAQMMAAGAKQQAVVRGLYGRSERSGEQRSGERSGEQRSGEQRSGDQRSGDRARVEAPVVAAAPVEAEVPAVEVTDVVETMVDGAPAPHNPGFEPVIEPDHIEAEPVAEAGIPEELDEPTPYEAPSHRLPMADFEAAAEVLDRRVDQLKPADQDADSGV